MAEVICNTSPMQYLHQLGQLELLRKLTGEVIVPPAVVDELAAGKAFGIDLPEITALDWITIRRPAGVSAERLVGDLGVGETEVLMLALESPDAVAVLDDALARRVAETLGIKIAGTLGILLDAKRAGHLSAVAPLLDQLSGSTIPPRATYARSDTQAGR